MSEVAEKAELAIGDSVWIQYNKGVYKGMDGDKHLVEYQEKNRKVIEAVSYRPVVFDESEYMGKVYDLNGSLSEVVGAVCWIRDEGPQIKIELNLTNRPTGSSKFVSISELPEPVQEYPWLSEEDMTEAFNELFSKLTPLRSEESRLEKEIEDVKKQIKAVEDEILSPIQKKCKHQWFCHEEESIGRNGLGEEFSTFSECEVCGLNKTTYATRIG